MDIIYSLVGGRKRAAGLDFTDERNAAVIAWSTALTIANSRRAWRELGTPDRFAEVVAVEVEGGDARYPIYPMAFPDLVSAVEIPTPPAGLAPVKVARLVGYRGTHRKETK